MSANPQSAAVGFIERLAQDLNTQQLELPAFPDSVIRIQRAFQDPDIELDEVVKILSSDPAVAAKLLQTANSAALNASGNEITNLRAAIVRMGYKLVNSVAMTFALRQLQQNQDYTAEQNEALEGLWNTSLDVASICYVIARKLTKVNPDDALLAGLLHVVGHLYVFMQAVEQPDLGQDELAAIDRDWHTAIAKAIVESWGMPEALATAMEQQDDYGAELAAADDGADGQPVSLTEVLLSAKSLAKSQAAGEAGPTMQDVPALKRVGLVSGPDQPASIEQFADDVAAMRAALAG